MVVAAASSFTLCFSFVVALVARPVAQKDASLGRASLGLRV